MGVGFEIVLSTCVLLLLCHAVLCCVYSSGIPLVFPQWRDGPLPFNGFADKMEWTVVGTVSHQVSM